MSYKYFLFLALALFYNTPGFGDNRNDDPAVIIHDTVVSPGELLLQIDAFNFIDENGQISALTLDIDIDTCLIKFVSIENIQVGGGTWMANYNVYLNKLSIIYTADIGTGQDINGKLLDLHLFYTGGFDASLSFMPTCEITNKYLQTIENVTYVDGHITQSLPHAGYVKSDTVSVSLGSEVLIPVVAGGEGFNSIKKISLKLGYMEDDLEFSGISEGVLSDFTVYDTNSSVYINWANEQAPINLTNPDTLLYLKFLSIGNENSAIEFETCSHIYGDDTLIPLNAVYNDGAVMVLYAVELINNPDDGGMVQGAGLYYENDEVTVIATPNEGFGFVSWTKNDSIVSQDSVYSFVKQAVNDTLIANYQPYQYSVTVIAEPDEGGNVSGGGIFYYGDTVVLDAVPNEGYDFVAWLNGDDTVSFLPQYNFVMPAEDLEFKGVFEKKSFTISASPNNELYGYVEGAGEYFYGDTAVLTAIPNENYNFISWTENGQQISEDSILSFIVTSNRDLIANFQLDVDCPAPVGLWVDSLSYTEALLHWQPSGDENSWKVLWGIQGFDTINEGNLVTDINENKYFLTGLSSGTVYQFYVKAVCEEGFESSWSEPFTFTTWYVGIDENVNDEIKIYPNPVRNILHVVFSEFLNEKLNIAVININGKKLNVVFSKNKNIINVDVSNLHSGIYFVKLNFSGKDFIKRFMVY